LSGTLWWAMSAAAFGLATITFWQAFGIVLLAKLLFGGFSHSERGHDGGFEKHFRDRFKKYARAEEVREDEVPLPGNGQKWRRFRQYWKDEGRAAFESYVQRIDEKEKNHQE